MIPTLLPVVSTPRTAGYPRPVTQLHQIEITSHCNLKCVYCPSPIMPGLRGQAPSMMARATFTRALEWAVHFDRQGTQGELALTGIGESLLHPDFLPMLREVRAALPRTFLTLSTNGLLLTEAIAAVMAECRLALWVSLHVPLAKIQPAIALAQKHGILHGVNAAAATASFNWAGQLKAGGTDWPVSAPKIPCAYLRDGWAVVLVDGRITTCCLDASGAGVVGHVDGAVGQAHIAPYSLCGACHMTIVEPEGHA